jgi:hypothetical protein
MTKSQGPPEVSSRATSAAWRPAGVLRTRSSSQAV